MGKKWHEFNITRKVLDTRMKKLTAKGIGTVAKSAHPLTLKQENALWVRSISSAHMAEELVKAVF